MAPRDMGPGVWASESTQWSWAFFLLIWIFLPVSPKSEFWVKQSISWLTPTAEVGDHCFLLAQCESIALLAKE